MTEREYWEEVRDTAESIVEDCTEEGLDQEGTEGRIWETCADHQWVIYCHYNYDVMKYSPNDGYYADNFGAESIIKDGALDTSSVAFGAFYADVSNEVWSLWDSRA